MGIGYRFLTAFLLLLLVPVGPVLSFELFLPLVLRDQVLGEVRAELDPDTAELRRVDADLLSMLQPNLRPETYRRLLQEVDEEGLLSVTKAAEQGLGLRFDDIEIVIRAQPSPGTEAPQAIVFGQRQRPHPDSLTPVAPFSAYVNVRALLENQVTVGAEGTENELPLGVGLEAAAARGQLSGRASAVIASEPGENDIVELERALLRYDFPLQRVRVEAGSTELPQSGLIGSQLVLGMSLRRDSQLDPYTARTTASVTELYLERPSEVEVWVNERRVERLQLPAGSFELRDYPLAAGLNKVEIAITDDLGRTETVQLTEPFNTQLLRPGEFEYHAGGGLDWRDRETRAASAVLRYGVTRRVSLGTGIQSTVDEHLAAVDATLALPVGNVRTDVGVHLGEPEGSFEANRALNLEYSFGIPWRRTLPRAAVSLRVQDADYRTPSPTEWQGPADLARLRISLSQSVLQRIGLSATYQKSWARSPNLDSDNIGMVATLSPNPGASLSLRLGYEWDEDGNTGFRGFIGYTHTLSGGRLSTSVGQDLAENTGTVSVRSNHEPRPGQSLSASGRLSGLPSHADNDWSSGAAVRYVTPYFESSVQHDSVFFEEGSVERRHRSGLQVGTALAYADGVFAPSRPINDAFVIFRRDPGLSDVGLEIRSEAGMRATPMERWGRVVAPGLRSYYPYTYFVDAPFLPEGYDLGPGTYTVVPGYQQGALINIGSDARVYVEGQLVNEVGEAVALTAGRLYMGAFDALGEPAQDEDGELFFSDRNGIFVVYGLRSGTYHLRMSGGRYAEFSIPEGEIGRFELGNIVLRRPEAEE